ncbi:MAG: response regulator transcription factor, partial [Aquabacterium sp.]
MIKVLLVDDHVIVRQGLRQVLADVEGIQVVDEAPDGAEALHLIRAWMDHVDGPGLDVVMLDIALPGRDGLDVLKQIKAEYPKLGVVMLSTYPDRQFAVRCLRAGAQAYLNKSADPDDMVAAIRKVAQAAPTSRPPWP